GRSSLRPPSVLRAGVALGAVDAAELDRGVVLRSHDLLARGVAVGPGLGRSEEHRPEEQEDDRRRDPLTAAAERDPEREEDRREASGVRRPSDRAPHRSASRWTASESSAAARPRAAPLAVGVLRRAYWAAQRRAAAAIRASPESSGRAVTFCARRVSGEIGAWTLLTTRIGALAAAVRRFISRSSWAIARTPSDRASKFSGT